MRTIICSLILVCVLSLSGVAQDCLGGTCPTRSVARAVVVQPVKVVGQSVQQVRTFTAKTVKRTRTFFGRARKSCCGCCN